jgi:penicillin amidase
MNVQQRVVLFLAAVTCFLYSSSFAEPNKEYGKIEIIRDLAGVPNIFSSADEGAMYGLGYAAAEDRAFQMYYFARIMQGRVSEFLGDEASHSKKGRDRALENDKLMRTLGWFKTAQSVAGNLDPDTRSLLQAYCEGVNDCISGYPDKLLYLFEKLGVAPEPWTPAHCLLMHWHLGYVFYGSGIGSAPSSQEEGDRSGRAPRGGAPVVDNSAAVVKREDVTEEWIRKTQEFSSSHGLKAEMRPGEAEPPKFSHAWVVGGTKTTTGAAVLVSDPQTLVRNPSLWYEFHVAGETFNARGIGSAGSPFFLIGYNSDVAWGGTALGATHADSFLLKTDADHPGQYEVDGEWLDMETREEIIAVKGGEPVTLTIRESIFGPVVTPFVSGVQEGQEIALKSVPLCEKNRDTVQATIGMMRARSADEFAKALPGWLFPSLHILFGDKDGNIGYWTAAAVPVRSFDSGLPGSIRDGSTRKSDWQGFVPFDLLPHVINPERGFVGSGNHLAIQDFYPIPIIGGGAGTGHTNRSRRVIERLEMKDLFTPQDVLDITYDMVNVDKRDLVRIGYYARDVQKAELSEDTLSALKHLETWFAKGAKCDLGIKGTALTECIAPNFRHGTTDLVEKYGGGQGGLCYWSRETAERLTNDPKAEISDGEIRFVDSSLAGGWRQAQQRYGPDPEKWQGKAIDELKQKPLGYFVNLDGYPSLDAKNDITFPYLSCIDGATIHSQMGQSYTQYIPLDSIDSAMTLLPIGISENPAHRSWKSNYETWSKGELNPAPISREAVEKIAMETLVLSD